MNNGIGFDSSKFIGNFKGGLRDGQGAMYWNDGSNFKGFWCHDERRNGTLVMSNGFVYRGEFINDKIHSKNSRLYLPTFIIY